VRFDPVSKSNPRAWLRATIGLVIVTGLVVVGLLVHSIWGSATLSYTITDDTVGIRYGPTFARIPRSQITDVRIHDELTGARRHFGTAITGLYQGAWSFRETGRITLYATDLDRLVVIEAEGRQWGISPADPEGFMQVLMSGGTGTFEPVRRASTPGLLALSLLPVAAIALSLMVIYPFLSVAGKVFYELDADALVIHGGNRRVKIPYATVTGVEVKNPVGRPWRIFGVSLPGLYWGDFSWRGAGPSLKMYATSLRPLVVVSCGKRTYGISPKDPDEFVAELKRRLGARR